MVELPAVYCADVGSVAAKQFAWAARGPAAVQGDSGSMEELAAAVAESLSAAVPVALGFECPMFVPFADDPRELTKARDGDGNRPWSAGAGCAVLTTGLVQVAWILRRVRELAQESHRAYLEWDAFRQAESGLFLWEAFVSGDAKRKDHVGDAEAALDAFMTAVQEGQPTSIVAGGGEVYSLVGAALLRTGWSTDLTLLSRPCLAVRAGG